MSNAKSLLRQTALEYALVEEHIDQVIPVEDANERDGVLDNDERNEVSYIFTMHQPDPFSL